MDFFWCSECGHSKVDVQQHLIYWQGQCVCDALFYTGKKALLLDTPGIK
jgi:hypothetical protein